MTQRNVSPKELIFIQSRAEINQSLIEEYTTMMADGVEFDAVDGVQDSSGQVYIWDGYHRGEAARSLNCPLLVNIQPGTRSDAEWLALTANQKHGLRRSHADKQYIVRKALLHPNGANLSNREIARHCGVDHKTVGKIREAMELSGEIPQIEKRTVNRNGTTYQQDTYSIGTTKQQWVPVWQLEQSVYSWLENTFSNKEAQIQVLEAIYQKTSKGQMYLTKLLTKDILPSPNRKRDIVQACHNLRGQHRQLERYGCEEFSQILQDKSGGETHKSPVTVASRSHPPLSDQLVRQDFECPRCGQEKIVGVNGSRRWCLNCLAEWPTADAFLAEVSAGGQQDFEQPNRHHLQSRFLNILARLDEPELAKVKTWLDMLEAQLDLAEDTNHINEEVAPIKAIPVPEYA